MSVRKNSKKTEDGITLYLRHPWTSLHIDGCRLTKTIVECGGAQSLSEGISNMGISNPSLSITCMKQ